MSHFLARALLCVLSCHVSQLHNDSRLSGVSGLVGLVCFALATCHCCHLMPVDVAAHPLFRLSSQLSFSSLQKCPSNITFAWNPPLGVWPLGGHMATWVTGLVQFDLRWLSGDFDLQRNLWCCDIKAVIFRWTCTDVTVTFTYAESFTTSGGE